MVSSGTRIGYAILIVLTPSPCPCPVLRGGERQFDTAPISAATSAEGVHAVNTFFESTH